jgi:uncharacterized protein YkwD
MGFGALRPRILRLTLAVPLLAMIALAVALGLATPRQAEALDSEEQSFLTYINDYRAQNGLGPLTINESLNGVARWMANDMATNNYFSHTDSLGRDPFARMDQLGYAYNTWRGENLAAGTETAPYAFQLWKDSPGHNANMLGTHYTVIGIARVFNQNSNYGWYWATEFGGEGGPAPAPPPAPVVTDPPPRAPATAYQPVPTIAPPISIVPPPAPTVEVTAAPTPTPWTGPLYEQTAWWRSLDLVGQDWEATVFARQLMQISPALEELFLTLLRGA